MLAFEKGKPTAQIAHLQFTRANAQTQNYKRAIFSPLLLVIQKIILLFKKLDLYLSNI